MTLIRLPRVLGIGTVIAPVPEPGDDARLGIPKHEGSADDAGILRIAHRNPNHVDTK